MASGQAVQGLQVAVVSLGAVEPTGRPRNAAGPALPTTHPPPRWVRSTVAFPHANWDLLSWASSLSLGTLCAPVSRDRLLPGGGGRCGGRCPLLPRTHLLPTPPLGETLTEGGGSYKRVYLRDLREPGKAVPLASRVSVGSPVGHRAPFSFTAGTRLWCPRRNSPYWLRTGSE